MKGESMALTHEAILSEKGQANIQIHSDPISAMIVSIMPWVSWEESHGTIWEQRVEYGENSGKVSWRS